MRWPTSAPSGGAWPRWPRPTAACWWTRCTPCSTTAPTSPRSTWSAASPRSTRCADPPAWWRFAAATRHCAIPALERNPMINNPVDRAAAERGVELPPETCFVCIKPPVWEVTTTHVKGDPVTIQVCVEHAVEGHWWFVMDDDGGFAGVDAIVTSVTYTLIDPPTEEQA